MHRVVESNLSVIRQLARDFGVEKLELFGSAVTDEFIPGVSDVDFIAWYPQGYDFGPWLSRFQKLEEALSEALGQEVNLVMPSVLQNMQFARNAASTRQVIYDASQNAHAA